MNNIIAAYAGKVYPDKTFTIGYCPREKKRTKDKQYDRDMATQQPRDDNAMIDWLIGQSSIEGEFRSISEAPLLVKGEQSSRKRNLADYGAKGITKYGKRVLRGSCAILQKKYGRRCLGFGTCTLPEMCEEALRVLLRNWGEVVRRFFQKIRRVYQKVNSQFIYCGCTEIQGSRFNNSGLPVPHLHFVYVARYSVRDRYILHSREDFVYWNQSVNEVLEANGYLPLMGNDGHRGSLKLEPVKKNAAAYIGKYVSKGITELKAMREAGFDEFPAQWWFASMQMKKWYKTSTIQIGMHACKDIIHNLERYMHEGYIAYCSFVYVCIGGEDRCVGLVGRLNNWAYKLIEFPVEQLEFGKL